jgi:hypothetical protein
LITAKKRRLASDSSVYIANSTQSIDPHFNERSQGDRYQRHRTQNEATSSLGVPPNRAKEVLRDPETGILATSSGPPEGERAHRLVHLNQRLILQAVSLLDGRRALAQSRRIDIASPQCNCPDRRLHQESQKARWAGMSLRWHVNRGMGHLLTARCVFT